MYDQDKLDYYQFGVLTGILGEQQSEVTIGGYNEESFEGEIISHAVSGSFHWSLNFVKFAYNDDFVIPSVGKALIDTGTTFLMLPIDDYRTLVDMIIADLPSTMKARSS
mmetsp:Transcript_38210/g.36565  ORF Transcript_38210/g.36565 Transcript_38210/m.36565 type:complete len:109 (+) Transcript_38210:258-584(+)